MTRQIDRETYLKAFALFVLGAEHYRRLLDSERLMNKTLGQKDELGSHISDALYSLEGPWDQHTFDEALSRAGIKVEAADGAQTS